MNENSTYGSKLVRGMKPVCFPRRVLVKIPTDLWTQDIFVVLSGSCVVLIVMWGK